MPKIAPSLKEELKAAGKWSGFVRRRDDLKAAGLSAKEALDQAIEEYRDQSGPEPPSCSEDLAGEVAPRCGSGSVHIEELPPVGDLLEGMKAGAMESIQWVAGTIELAKTFADEDELVDLARQAPSGLAVGLLLWVLRSPANASVFWTQIWTKTIPSRPQSERGPRFYDDGRQHFEILDELRAAPESD